MSGRDGNAIGANVNKNNTQGRASISGANRSGVATGGQAINFPRNNRPSPDPSYFGKARAIRSADPRYREQPR